MQRNNRKFVRGEKHHWWPAGLSQYWTNDRGLVGRITANGPTQEIPPKKLARISNGHNIMFDEASSWGQTFEQDYDRVDSDFPKLIEWLNSLKQKHQRNNSHDTGLFIPHACEDALLERLHECMVSLVVRSPRFRSSVVCLAERLRGTIDKKERKLLAAANVVHTLQENTEHSKGQGKFAVFFSESSEFIYGDGFYNNLTKGGGYDSTNTRILVPLTPNLVVLYALPTAYMTEPKLVTKKASSELVSLVNETVQIYSKDYLFYRSEIPSLSQHFLAEEHRRYADIDPIDQLVEAVPGIGGLRGQLFPFQMTPFS